MQKINLLLVIVASINLFTTCKNDKKDTNQNKSVQTTDTLVKESKKERVIPTDKKYNEIARFIAGLPQEASNPLQEYEKTETWKGYSQESNRKWQKLKEGKLAKMQTWADVELKEVNQKGGTLFYPFSGADFLHAQVFFPNLDETIMIGLEPIGNPLNIEKIAKKQTNYFSALNKAGYFLAEFSFFRTNDMAVDLTGKRSIEVDGTIHLIMLYLAQLDNTITYYEKVVVDTEGNLIPASEHKEKVDSSNKKKKVVYGNRIFFKRKNDDKIRSVIYFSANLSDYGLLEENPDFRKYLEKLKPTATYLKAASYLMYSVQAPGKNYNFKIIRDIILKNSQYVLQDDSGMPLSNFADNSKWQKTFYGVYAGPISLFSNRYQTAMREAYKNKENVKPLPFGIGYQFREGTSNLMLAKKIGEVTDKDLEVKVIEAEKKEKNREKNKEKSNEKK
ncbi:hypothetical protein [Raineya orbicola]|uniref:Uncharacterized protein n=1 Tax=Raineya orbicola TaxID=2016530 RepID=A0A2N3I323_9BACT|nr:hypothetical protein [Raineya orbicola]PKQ64702.1 hypothetical protein Rain11_2589 [Raineya orbicola]